MMWLLFDIGNSQTKWRLQSDTGVIERGNFPTAHWSAWQAKLAGELNRHQPARIAVSNVAGDVVQAGVELACRTWWQLQPFFARSEQQGQGLVNQYDEPDRLGVDRWLAMVGAYGNLGGGLCVCDAGTALTLDLITPEGQYAGGYILPGLQLMQTSLEGETAGIGFKPITELANLLEPGLNTQKCISSGLSLWVKALTCEINKLAQRWDYKVVLTGGDRTLLSAHLESAVVLDELVLDGLLLRAQSLLD